MYVCMYVCIQYMQNLEIGALKPYPGQKQVQSGPTQFFSNYCPLTAIPLH